MKDSSCLSTSLAMAPASGAAWMWKSAAGLRSSIMLSRTRAGGARHGHRARPGVRAGGRVRHSSLSRRLSRVPFRTARAHAGPAHAAWPPRSASPDALVRPVPRAAPDFDQRQPARGPRRAGLNWLATVRHGLPVDWPEPFGLAMIEALACGTPLVARPCGAVPEIIRDGEIGFLRETVEQLAAAVKR